MFFKKKRKNYREIYDDFSRALYEANHEDRHDDLTKCCHLYFVYDMDKKKSTNYSTSIVNNNFPELLEALIHEHLSCICDDKELSEEETVAHYKWLFNEINKKLDERLHGTNKAD